MQHHQSRTITNASFPFSLFFVLYLLMVTTNYSCKQLMNFQINSIFSILAQTVWVICLLPIFRIFQFLEDCFSNFPKLQKTVSSNFITYLDFLQFLSAWYFWGKRTLGFLKFSSVIIRRTKCVAIWQKKIRQKGLQNNCAPMLSWWNFLRFLLATAK